MERVRRVLPFDFLRLGSILVPRQILPPKYVASKARNRSTASVCVNDTKAVYYVGVRAGEQGRRSWMRRAQRQVGEMVTRVKSGVVAVS